MTEFDAKVYAAIPPGATTIKRIRFVLGSTARTSKIMRAIARLAKAGQVAILDKHRVERKCPD